ncbi:ABC transporter ATP-binding protein [Actinomadura sp. 7K534]|uniref:ABC transporter ATP-binding protein n=1 Tax=Actinomadura sp. 7K534 TaxID=2530366 RepID=UPI0010511837|nr:ABC transporter ATP-binding protein [Actinomadura sp. 7K534]TDB98511.1 ABC transporter ATP-binding protein [Actinomadura sp. 7K534]
MRTPGTAEARGVTRRFGGLTAVSDVSFTVAKGEIHGIIGPNGAGKTTLLNVLSGLQRPSGGSVLIGGEDVTRWPSHRLVTRARLVRTFQTVRLFSSMSVRENLMIAARATTAPAQARERVEEVLGRLALDGLANEPGAALSYGLQRRVELARVMVADPAVVLLDEPAAGLSPQERGDLADMLREMRDSGVTVILVEHHMDLVHAVCENCTVLDFGKVIARGTPDEVTRDPAVLEAYLGGRHHRATDVDAPVPTAEED